MRFRTIGDRLLAKLVPTTDAGACSEYYRCYQQMWYQVCYRNCGRPTFCRTISKCLG